MKTQVAGEVDFDPVRYDIPARNARRMSQAPQMALAAASLAIADSNLSLETIRAQNERSGVVLETANAGFEVLLKTSLAGS